MSSWSIKVNPAQWETLSAKERANLIHLWGLEAKLEVGAESLQEILEITKELSSYYQLTKTKPTKLVSDVIKTIETEAKILLISQAKKLVSDPSNPKHIDPKKIKELMLYHPPSFVDDTIFWARQGGLNFEMDGKIRTIDLRFGQ